MEARFWVHNWRLKKLKVLHSTKQERGQRQNKNGQAAVVQIGPHQQFRLHKDWNEIIMYVDLKFENSFLALHE